MALRKLTGMVAMAAMLASCGGGGDGRISQPPGPENPAPTPTPTGSCSLSERQDWVLGQLQQFYLFPELLDTSVNKANYDTVQSYIDAVVAPARAEGIDRGFTYITSIQEEEEFIENAISEDYGWRPVLFSDDTLYLRETYENAAARGAGIERGDEILRLGRSSSSLRTPAQIIADDGGSTGDLADLLFPSTSGESLVVEWQDDETDAVRTVTLRASEYELLPVSPDYGVEIFGDTGYLNLRTFFSQTAQDDLRDAFTQFDNAGVRDIIVDLRYNGGGLVSVAEYMGDLLGGGLNGQVFSYTTFNDQNSASNDRELFEVRSNSIDPDRIAFITTGSSASASELVANSMLPYYGNQTALVGSDTFGKPVGQIARDRPECDDRLRVMAFRTENADRQGDYYDGLASVFETTCRASDNIFEDLGTRTENSIAQALDFTASGPAVCTPIAAAGQSKLGGREAEKTLLPSDPSVGARVSLGQL